MKKDKENKEEIKLVDKALKLQPKLKKYNWDLELRKLDVNDIEVNGHEEVKPINYTQLLKQDNQKQINWNKVSARDYAKVKEVFEQNKKLRIALEVLIGLNNTKNG